MTKAIMKTSSFDGKHQRRNKIMVLLAMSRISTRIEIQKKETTLDHNTAFSNEQSFVYNHTDIHNIYLISNDVYSSKLNFHLCLDLYCE